MLKNLSRVFLVTCTFFSVFPFISARAEHVEPLNDTFNRAINNSSGTLYDISNISGQANIIFGWRSFPGSFPENQITEDGKTMEILMKDSMDRQDSSLPIQTRDLPNPYTTSIGQNPAYTNLVGKH